MAHWRQRRRIVGVDYSRLGSPTAAAAVRGQVPAAQPPQWYSGLQPHGVWAPAVPGSRGLRLRGGWDHDGQQPCAAVMGSCCSRRTLLCGDGQRLWAPAMWGGAVRCSRGRRPWAAAMARSRAWAWDAAVRACSWVVAVRGHGLQPWLGAAFVRGRGLRPGTCDAGSWAMAVRDGHEPQPCGREGVCDPALWGIRGRGGS